MTEKEGGSRFRMIMAQRVSMVEESRLPSEISISNLKVSRN